MKFAASKMIASVASKGDVDQLIKLLQPIADKGGKRGTWSHMSAKMIRFLQTGNPEFTVIAEGNSKLPFLAFSALPFVSCPGMGACSTFCYSIRAWRYPAAFFRQLQNTILLQTESGRATIADALDAELNRRKFRSMERVDFRLYVDGDFNDEKTMAFWFDLIAKQPRLAAYGYSKSFELFKAWSESGKAFPNNYVLNLSSGSKYDNDTDMLAYMAKLPITRGKFIALPIVGKFSAANGDYATKEYRDAVRSAADKADIGKVFVCPGRCGTCTGKGHACGNSQLNVPIAIGLH